MAAEAQLEHTKRQIDYSDKALVHELQVHQIELEMQNESLLQTQLALEKSRDHYIEFYDFAPAGYITLDSDALITEINLTAATLLGNDRSKLLKRHFSGLLASEDGDRWHLYFKSVLQHDGIHSCELSVPRGDETSLDVRLDSRYHMDSDKVQTVRIVMTDNSERKAEEKRIGFLATHDRLTQLPNRDLFYDRLSQAISQSKRKHKPFAILFLDLDGFKGVNDIYGHEAGDAVLIIAAKRFQTCIRSMDTIARLGGDEFAIILDDLHEIENASSVAVKIIGTLSESIKLKEVAECKIGVSIGIAIYPQNGLEIDTLMHAADTAMYQSKSSGKNRFQFFNAKTSKQDSSEPWINFDSTKMVNVKVIDRQHAKLAELFNTLNAAFNHGKPINALAIILDEIAASTQFHFDTENSLMKHYNFPGRLEHMQEHKNLLDEFVYLKKKFLGGGEAVVLQTMKNWLLLHISEFDMPLAVYLISEHGVV
jgi:diguanylate cyclase (GGDEF)-like protein/hemerythrin-like metal-binding protein/PAS domain S-box-containing protein